MFKYNKNIQNQGMMIHMPQSADFGLGTILHQGSDDCSNLKFHIRIHIYKYNRKILESGYDNPYVTVIWLQT